MSLVNASQRKVENSGHFITGCMNYFDGTCIDRNHFLALELYVSAAYVLCLGICCIILLLLACHQILFIFLYESHLN
jgi:hypothetical protein